MAKDANGKPTPERGTLWVDKAMIAMAKVIATHDPTTTISEVMEDAARTALTRRYRKTVDEMHGAVIHGGEG